MPTSTPWLILFNPLRQVLIPIRGVFPKGLDGLKLLQPRVLLMSLAAGRFQKASA